MNEIKSRLKGILLSRKFQVFAIATILLIFGKLTPGVWSGIAIAYMASNAVQKLGGKNEKNNKID